MNIESFFEELRRQTAAAFEKAPVRALQHSIGRSWNYSLCATPIRKKTGIIFGLNWGGGGEADLDPDTGHVRVYAPQTTMPDGSDVASYRFVRLSAPYLEQFLGVTDAASLNYSNACFFRTPSVADLKREDWNLSIPLFQQYIRYIDPPWLLMLGTSGLPVLQNLNFLSDVTEHDFTQSSRTHYSYSGMFDLRPFMCVPHPSARVPRAVRLSLWAQAYSASHHLPK